MPITPPSPEQQHANNDLLMAARTAANPFSYRCNLGDGWEGAHIRAFNGRLIVAHPNHPPLMIDIEAKTVKELSLAYPVDAHKR